MKNLKKLSNITKPWKKKTFKKIPRKLSYISIQSIKKPRPYQKIKTNPSQNIEKNLEKSIKI